jgi:hypothetical protein
MVAASHLVTRKGGSFTKVVSQVCEKRSRACRFPTSTASSVLVAVVLCAGALYLHPSSAVAQRVHDGGLITNCTGDPATFPSGGAIAFPGDTTLNVFNLTNNIGPPVLSNGTPGISLQTSGADGSDATIGSIFPPEPPSSATSGHPGPNISIQFTDLHTVTASGANGVIGTTRGGQGGDGIPIPFLSSGAAGGGGGSVVILTQGAISASGAAGVLATAIGGNGGTGGDVTGGNGGAGGSGGEVIVTVQGAVTTTLDNAPGVSAASGGGTGGNGGLGVIISPGNGAASGGGGHVKVTTSGVIETSGASSPGIWARSYGGGGGNGGDGLLTTTSTGGGAGAGGLVEVISSSPTITTGGAKSPGIFAQSIGGFAGGGGSTFDLLASFGGDAKSGGGGGDVRVTTSAGNVITTNGVGSNAIFAQSGGGGGGAGGAGGALLGGSGGAGAQGGSGTLAFVSNSATLNVNGFESSGIFAQSFGGGGGTGGAGGGLLIGIGGSGGDGGKGGPVEVHNFANINVSGNGSLDNVSGLSTVAAGIYAQSIGGGGGNGALGGALVVGVGGSGGPGGSAGGVFVENTASIAHIECLGCIEAPTIFAQSVGGGGGDGGTAGSPIAVGGRGGKGGDGNVVRVNNSGNLTAYGDMSPGLFAQSVGGGGGNGGSSIGIGVFLSVAVGGTGGVAGNGGDVCVNADGTCSNLLSTLGASNTKPTAFVRQASWRSRSVAAVATAAAPYPPRCPSSEALHWGSAATAAMVGRAATCSSAPRGRSQHKATIPPV